MIKVLHTSDWHLGRELYHQDRNAAFKKWLDWLVETLRDEHIDVLVVAGDIFDVINVPTSAQELYYRFLTEACRHCQVFVTSGNHDSGRFIDAPATLMQSLNITVVGRPRAPEEEVFVVRDAEGQPQLIVCAVPFLRQDDLYNLLSPEERTYTANITQTGLKKHYAAVAKHAQALRDAYGQVLPVLAMGHLMTSGAVKGGDDGVRDLYVGSLEGVDDGIFPDTFDYVALGHIHRPQRVSNRDDIRYSGSPIAMGFDERCDDKHVCIITFDGRHKTIQTKPIPVFQRLIRVEGSDIKDIKKALKALVKANDAVWVEVNYTGQECIRNLEDCIKEILSASPVRCIHVRNASYVQHLLNTPDLETTELKELDPKYIFDVLLSQQNIVGEDADVLRETYREALLAVLTDEEDAHSLDA